MKKTLFLTLAALLFGLAAYAQQPVKSDDKVAQMPTAEQIAQRRADRLQQQLLLGKDQYKKVYKLCLEQAERDVARMQQQKAEKESMSKAMKGILNDAQYERFEQIQNTPRYGRFHNHRGMQPQQKPCCDKATRCAEAKPCCKKGGQPVPAKDVAEVNDVKSGSAKYDIQKGDRIRMVGDPRRNQNAYNYIEGAAEN